MPGYKPYKLSLYVIVVITGLAFLVLANYFGYKASVNAYTKEKMANITAMLPQGLLVFSEKSSASIEMLTLFIEQPSLFNIKGLNPTLSKSGKTQLQNYYQDHLLQVSIVPPRPPATSQLAKRPRSTLLANNAYTEGLHTSTAQQSNHKVKISNFVHWQPINKFAYENAPWLVVEIESDYFLPTSTMDYQWQFTNQLVDDNQQLSSTNIYTLVDKHILTAAISIPNRELALEVKTDFSAFANTLRERQVTLLLTESCMFLLAVFIFYFVNKKVTREQTLTQPPLGKEEVPPSSSSVAAVESDEKKLNHSSINILLVEDNAINQKVTGGILSRYQLNFHIIENGKQALEYLADNDVDLILMDLKLPVMNGYDATEKIRSELKMYDVPIVALTVLGKQDEINRAMAVGVTEYLVKPISERKLISTLQRLIKNKPITIKHVLPFSPPAGVNKNHADTVVKRSTPPSESLFNISFARKQTMNNDNLLKQLCAKFVSNYSDCSSTIRTLNAEKNIKELDSLLHNIKGVAGNLGLIALHQITEQLNNQIKLGTLLSANQEATLNTIIDQTINVLSNYIDQAPSQTAQQKTKTAPFKREEFDLLIEKVQSNELINDSFIASVVHSLPDIIEEPLRSNLAEALDDFDYEKSMEYLKVIKDKIDNQ
ncbi:response regulator [Flocculibacter collagenilyticus]|uniref:response regulator n=1 Tax=Flocculibacter collagenilyticus TaxID=2744479 RepID=UPI0018F5FDE0|nr:response regulator [Flocculibacter collagenilyticus]